jgi:hypothetical protein
MKEICSNNQTLTPEQQRALARANVERLKAHKANPPPLPPGADDFVPINIYTHAKPCTATLKDSAETSAK